ncbi:hypothetical protein [Solibacillus sp. NPDC093137]|uniref:hypothetical protein n=1 Tax=Solibacillus sp. NPDC093137 TaxID=3390678 RepID=UPI003CFD75E2
MENKNNKTNTPNNDGYEGCLKGCLIVVLVLILSVFLLKSCFDAIGDIPSKPVKSGDFNYDGEVDVKDAAEFLEWKSKQDD